MVGDAELSTLSIRVSGEDAGGRVERLVMKALGCSRSEAQALCADGHVTLQGKRVKKGERAPLDAELRIESPEAWVVASPEAELTVRLERADLVVVSKPAGMPSVPLKLGERGTLANALVARYPEMRGFGWAAREPGLVHRLDTQTSGLLLAARTESAFRVLADALTRGAMQKRYLAVVEASGLGDSGSIEGSLEPDPSRRGRVAVASEHARYHRFCVTRYRVVARGPRFALVEVDASPAFRHQVRAHLASIGHPIAGDALYGGPADPRLGARHALHASHIGYAGPELSAFAVDDPEPAEFGELMDLGAR